MIRTQQALLAEESDQMQVLVAKEAQARKLAEQSAKAAQAKIEELRANEENLRRVVEQEIDARRTAELAAVSALEQLKRLQVSGSGPAATSGVRHAETHNPAGVTEELGQFHQEVDAEQSSRRWKDAFGAPAVSAQEMLQVGVLSWASELGVEVVSPIIVSEGPEESVHKGEGDDSVAGGVLLASSQHVRTESGPEVFERPSGAGELEDDSVDLSMSEGKEEELGSEGKGWMVRESCEHEALSTVMEPSGDEEIPEELDVRDDSSSSEEEEEQGLESKVSAPVKMQACSEAAPETKDASGEGEVTASRSMETVTRQDLLTLDSQNASDLPTKTFTFSPEAPLMPARVGDPNHPLRKDEIDASDCTLNSEVDETASVRDQMYSVVETGNRLRASVNATLDQYNIARASGSRQAMADVIAALRHSQHVISQVLEAYDSEVLQQSSKVCEDTPSRTGNDDRTPPRETGEQAPQFESLVTPLPVFNTDSARSARNVPVLPLIGSHALSAPSSSLPSARSSVDLGGSVSQRSQFGTNYSAISVATDDRSAVNLDLESVLERYSERLLMMVSSKLSSTSK